MTDNNGFYLFLSLDIINSTMYKTKDPDWSQLFIKIYDKTIALVRKTWVGCKLWKTLGDELCFYCKVKNKKDLIASLAQVYDVAIKSNNLICNLSQPDVSIKLGFKTTFWSAIVKNSLGTNKSEWLYTNIWMKDSYGRDTLDFIGPDVDIGFRIAKSSHKNIVLIDAKLAYVFSVLIPTFNKNSKIVLFEQLKGVWDQCHYPIVWFCQDWKQLIDSFYYEDKFNSKVIMWIESENSNKLHNVAELARIFQQLKKTKEIEAIYKILNIK